MPIITGLCVLLYFFHSIAIGLLLLNILPYHPIYKNAGVMLLALILFHLLYHAVKEARKLYLQKTSVIKSRLYVRQNKRYYGQRLSGVLLLIFIFLHFSAYGYSDADGYHVRHFNEYLLFNQLMLIVLAGVHMFLGARSLIISLKVDTAKKPGRIALVVLQLLVVFSIFISCWGVLSYYSSF